MKQEKKFRQEEQVSQTESQSQTSQTIHEFATPEEMLRYDAKRTQVPGQVARRLSQSLQSEPPASRPWWQRWLR